MSIPPTANAELGSIAMTSALLDSFDQSCIIDQRLRCMSPFENSITTCVGTSISGLAMAHSLKATEHDDNPPSALTKVPDYTQNLIYPGLYAPSGFDMMNILIRVATRPNPKIPIGAVDASCALVLCDVSKPDIPIVYCSEAFEKLTGYGKNEALGVNCRFLQSPDGKVQAGSKRLHDDNGRLFALKKRILTLDEAQTSIVNYKKGGQSFTNLLTLIPIRWDSAEIRFLVGFQVDERGLYR